jgi:chromosome segregation ATPase
MKKMFMKLIIGALSLAMAFTVLSGCDAFLGGGEQNSYVSLSINPAVEFIVDENNTVTAVNCVNEDAEILLSGTDLTGENIFDATETFVDLATDAGYIDVESSDNEVTLDVISGDSKIENKIKDRIRQRINKFFENNGIFGRVSEETLAEFGEEVNALDIPLGHKKMILRALQEDPTLDINTLKDMPLKDIIALFKDKVKDGLDSGLRQQFNEQKRQLQEQFRQEVILMHQQAIAEINARYANMFELEAQIGTLNEQIAAFEGTDEDLAALQSQLASLTAEYNTLKAAYDAEIQAANEAFEQMREQYREKKENLEEQIRQAMEEYKQQREELRNAQRQRIQQRINENREKLEQHIREFLNRQGKNGK